MEQEENAECNQDNRTRGHASSEIAGLPGTRLAFTRTKRCCKTERIWRGTAGLNGSSCVHSVEDLIHHKKPHPDAKNDVPVIRQI